MLKWAAERSQSGLFTAKLAANFDQNSKVLAAAAGNI
jgi:hypothetical protein